MAFPDASGTRRDGRTIDQLTLEDGTLVVYDHASSDAWIECRSPALLHRLA